MPSIKKRFGYTLASNVVRSLLSFLVGILLARGLGPEKYGAFAFLLGSFAAFRALLDLGTSTAFFTFLSQRPRPRNFIFAYAGWQALQFFLPLLGLLFLVPETVLHVFWVGQDREVVAIAFVASFLMQQTWQTISQIGDAQRLTINIQSINLAISIVHLVFVVLAWVANLLSVNAIFILIAIEYMVASIICFQIIGLPATSNDPFDLRQNIREYVTYCKPLILYTLLSFVYAFADNWMLQRFAGSTERAYYATALQLASACMLGSNAILPIFWKEIAEAHQRANGARLEVLCGRTMRFIFMGGAVLGGGLLPWSQEVTVLMFGSDFANGATTVAVMSLYPAYASAGQIIGTMFIATGNTKAQVEIGIPLMAIGMLISYLMLAPSDAWIPGIALGAFGMAAKSVILTILATNVMTWRVARDNKWPFDWRHQGIAIGVTLLVGYAIRILISGIDQFFSMPPVLQVILGLSLYSAMIATLLWNIPSIAGATRNDLEGFRSKTLHFLR